MRNNKFVILCVDDDMDVLDQFKVVLEANGYICIGASTAEEGLKVYKDQNPDLLIVDLMMEKVDSGMALLEDLRSSGCHAPIYMFSAVGQQLGDNMDISRLKIAGVFQKPVEFKELLTTLKNKLKA